MSMEKVVKAKEKLATLKCMAEANKRCSNKGVSLVFSIEEMTELLKEVDEIINSEEYKKAK